MTTKITFGNFKGGVGKTTTTAICSYLLQEQKYKVLVIDFDPSADCTRTLASTFGYSLEKYTSVYEAMSVFDLSKAKISLSPYLDLVPSGRDLADFGDLLREATKGKPNPKSIKNFFLQMLVTNMLNTNIESEYDFIIFDVPPTESDLSNNALIASDFVIPIMQTEKSSYEQTKSFINHIQKLRKNFNSDNPDNSGKLITNVSVLGVVCYLESKRSGVDKDIVNKAKEEMNDLLFKTHVYKSDRIKRYAFEITRNDFHDKRTLKIYENLVKEILKKVGK